MGNFFRGVPVSKIINTHEDVVAHNASLGLSSATSSSVQEQAEPAFSPPLVQEISEPPPPEVPAAEISGSNSEPEATEPEATEPEATEPEATEPEATEPEATEPEATERSSKRRR
jgi:hypothetical protein